VLGEIVFAPDALVPIEGFPLTSDQDIANAVLIWVNDALYVVGVTVVLKGNTSVKTGACPVRSLIVTSAIYYYLFRLSVFLLDLDKNISKALL
jgi:hypothetical protein